MEKNKIERSDLDLIEGAKNFDSQCLKELMEKYGGIYDSIVRRFNFSKNYIKQDIIDDKPIFFYETAKSFNPCKKTKFSTYLYNMTNWSCLDRLKKDRKRIDPFELDLQSESFDPSKTTQIIERMRSFDERTQYIFMRRFFQSKKKASFCEIGKELNLTYEGVRQIYLKHIKILKKSHDKT